MEFQNIDQAIAYIRQAIADSMDSCSTEIKKIMDETMDEQIKGWTGQMFDSVVPHCDDTSAEAGFEDNGYWESWVTGEEVGNPIKFVENGTTKGREASNIMEVSSERCEKEIPEKLKELLQSKRIPIQ